MKTRGTQAVGAVLVLPAFAAVACSYDFDRFVREQTAPVSAAGATSGAGRGGTGGAAAGLGGQGGGGVAGSASEKSGEAGASSEAGAAGAEMGGSGGSAGQETAGKANGAGEGGKASSAGQGGSAGGPAGATNTGGQGGKPSAGAGGSSGASCTGSGATVYAGHCYFVVGDDTPIDWSSAKSACAAHASTAHLVSIGSKEEQAMLVSSFFPATIDTWIGLSLADVTKDPSSACKLSPDQCPFAWVTGEKLSYTDWTVRSGTDSEPNYTGACVRMQATDQTWGDTSCSGKLRAICEDGG